MEDYRRTVDGVSLSEEDIYNLEMWNWALGQNGNESVSEFASRFGEKNDYKSRLIHSMGINVGVCFQIKGW